ncbi:mitochondrial fission process 1 family protein [Aspergillus undulatus]|uniref:mitochondrial fission process 1 family protein n=1 Tax=Aspergillus undulatus TaxID=1810928 RepID=UPI003CCDECE5
MARQGGVAVAPWHSNICSLSSCSWLPHPPHFLLISTPTTYNSSFRSVSLVLVPRSTPGSYSNMFWGNRKDDEHPEPPPPSARRKLSPHFQAIIDQDDHFYDDVYSPYAIDSTETPYRYAGYATRLRTLLLSAHRYVAYTSDIGESFRPIAHPYLVRTAYGISWTYLLGDVAHEGYKAYLRNRRVLAPPCEAYKDSSDLSHQQIMYGMVTGDVAGSLSSPLSSGKGDEKGKSEIEKRGGDSLTPWPSTHIPLIEDYRTVMVKRAVFQSVASMGLPALTIHSVVRYSGRALKGSKSTFARTWVPVGLGLSVVPFLPYIFDHPVEGAVDWLFRVGLYVYGGEDAVKPLPKHSEVAASRGHDADSTSLSHFHISAPEGQGRDKDNVSWDEYKQELARAKEARRQEREASGGGILAMLGFGGKGRETQTGTQGEEGKRKTE